jgi:hypothetical protein
MKVNRCFGRTYHLHLQRSRIIPAINQMKQAVSLRDHPTAVEISNPSNKNNVQ